ncbi:MAG TPA: VOC family protein [Gemmatimonadaceae bacterium]
MSLDYGVAPSGYRLPDAMRLGRVRLQVSDLARSIAYYESVIGLRTITRDAETARLGTHGGDTVIVELRERRGATPVPRRGLLGLYHFAILVPDRSVLGRFLRHATALGVHVGMSDHLVSEAIYLTDPDGLGIEVYADRPRESWRKVERQIAMATDPLDAENLMAAGGGAPFTGLPAGTVIGHVHLHVGDIEKAAHFYHEGLGFDKMVWNYPGALFLAAGGYHHHLGTNTWAAGRPSAGDGDARLLEWEVQVPTVEDAHAALESVAAAGHPVERDASGGTVSDPWGTTVRVRSTNSFT